MSGRRRTVLAGVVLVGFATIAGLTTLRGGETPEGTAPAGAQIASGAPPARGYFRTLPAKSALPSGTACARRVHRSGWEPRPGNRRFNRRVPRRAPVVRARLIDFDRAWNARYRPRISGRFTGTTDEIIQWAACKWGLSDNLLRAQASAESGWRQRAAGDLEPRASGRCTRHDRRDPCPTSFGLLQTKWIFHRPGYPMLRTMTAFHLDWSAAQLRGCFDGHKRDFPANDLAGCVGNWFSGEWRDADSRAYVARIRTQLRTQPWRRWPDRG